MQAYQGLSENRRVIGLGAWHAMQLPHPSNQGIFMNIAVTLPE
jgi:hypothetical protein